MSKIQIDEAVVRQAQQVPLHELLAKVPADARLVIEDKDGCSTSFIPVGRLCQEAATVIRQALADAEQPAPAQEHEFKNFHRLLCERFEYTHDERDWKRDQISLIEWIAKMVTPAPAQACDHDWKYIGSKRQAMWECTKCGMYKVPDEQPRSKGV